MVFFIPGFDPFGSGQSADGGEAGVVNGQRISEFDRLKAQNRERFVTEFLGGQRAQNQSRATWNRVLQLDMAEKAGVVVSDYEVNQAVRGLVNDMGERIQRSPSDTEDDKINNLREFAAREYKIPVDEFQPTIKEAMTLMNLRQGFSDTVLVPEFDVVRAFRDRSDRYKMEYTLVPNELDASTVEVSEEQIQEYYDNNAFEFFQPELRKAQLVSFNYIDFTDADSISSNEVAEYYSINASNYYRQVTIPNPAYALDTNNNETVRTWEVTPLEEVAGQIRTNIALAGDAPTLAADEALRLIDELKAGTNSLDEISAGFTNINVVVTDFIAATNTLNSVDADVRNELRTALFGISTNVDAKVSDAPVTGQNAAYVAIVTDSKASRTKDLSEVADAARAGAQRMQADEIFVGQLETKLDAVKAAMTGSNTFSNVVSTVGLAPIKTGVISPSLPSSTNFPNFFGIARELGGLNPGEFVSPTSFDDGKGKMGLIALLADRSPSPTYLTDLNTDRPQIAGIVQRRFAAPLQNQWFTTAQKNSGVEELEEAAVEREESRLQAIADAEAAARSNELEQASGESPSSDAATDAAAAPVKAATDASSAAADAVKGSTEAMTDAAKGAAGSAAGAVKEAGAAATDAAKGAAGAASDAATGSTEAVKDAGKGGLNLLKKAGDAAKGAAGSAAGAVKDADSAAADTAGDAGKGGLNMLKKAGDAAKGAAGSAAGAVKDAGSAAADTAGDAGKGGLDLLKKAGDAAKGAAGSAAGAVKDAGSAAADTAGDAGKGGLNLLKKAGDAATGAGSAVKETGKGGLNLLEKAGSAVKGAAGSATETAADAAKGAGSAIKEAVTPAAKP